MATMPPAGATPATAKPMTLPHSKGTLASLAILLLIGEGLGWLGYFFTKDTQPMLANAFASASVTLFFGALLGGVIQVLFSDLELRRANRAANAEFVGNILADLKAVYDRVERARTLILAHQSAKTYGDEVRDLIEYRVKLQNVIRALDKDQRASWVPGVKIYVLSMKNYLDKIVDEFRVEYKETSKLQRLHEAQVDSALKAGDVSKGEALLKENKPWEKISQLKAVQDWKKQDNGLNTAGEPKAKSEYQEHFVEHLDAASKNLRAALRGLFN